MSSPTWSICRDAVSNKVTILGLFLLKEQPMNMWVKLNSFNTIGHSKGSSNMKMEIRWSIKSRFCKSRHVQRRSRWKWSALKIYSGIVCIWRMRRTRGIGKRNKGSERRRIDKPIHCRHSLKKHLMLTVPITRQRKTQSTWGIQRRERKWRRGRSHSYTSREPWIQKRLPTRKAKADRLHQMLRTINKTEDSRKTKNSRAVAIKTNLGSTCWVSRIVWASWSQALRLEENSASSTQITNYWRNS